VPNLTGNPAIDTAIGLAFVYFLLSLVVSSLTEAISSVLQLRWRTLRRGLRELLLNAGEKSKDVLKKLDKINKAITALDRGDLKKAKTIAANDLKLDLSANPDADALRKKLEGEYPHVTKFENSDRIKALWKQTGFLATLPWIGNRGPSYIEPRTFALTLLETLGAIPRKQADDKAADSGQNAAERAAADEVKAQELAAKGMTTWVKREPDDLVLDAARIVVSEAANPALDKWLRDAITEAKGERDKLLASIESSFDAMTNRISGWYKRYATIWVILISAAVAFALNADSYAMGSRLWKDEAVRSTLVAEAAKLVDPATCDVKKTQSGQAGGSPTSTTTPGTESTETTPATTEPTETTPTTTESTTTAPTTTSPSNSTGASESNPAAQAKTAIQRASDCVTAVKALQLPLGWGQENRPNTAGGWFAKFGGIVITVFALMLGAPFWFDTLSKLARLRATGKPEGTGTKSE
jgi:hypothetical protein